jgi:hypothetical protein
MKIRSSCSANAWFVALRVFNASSFASHSAADFGISD